ncbi:hypothetical protein J6590_098665 [Homalodisca vitripennis]|nr:hypothetical protein J6590_098665 [Homalodisca vitripennis]
MMLKPNVLSGPGVRHLKLLPNDPKAKASERYSLLPILQLTSLKYKSNKNSREDSPVQEYKYTGALFFTIDSKIGRLIKTHR